MSNTTNDIPGNGWSNGDLPPSMFPVTRQGRIELYGANRRWINLHKGWTRIGSGHQHDFRHSTSGVGEAHEHDSPEEEAATVRSLIAQLCESFYQRGWATVSFVLSLEYIYEESFTYLYILLLYREQAGV
jgi:hypothetical protein